MKREDVEVGDYVRCEDSLGCVYIGRIFLKQVDDALVQILKLEKTSERGAKGPMWGSYAGTCRAQMADAFGGDTDYYQGQLYSVADYDSSGSKEWMIEFVCDSRSEFGATLHSTPAAAKPAVKADGSVTDTGYADRLKAAGAYTCIGGETPGAQERDGGLRFL